MKASDLIAALEAAIAQRGDSDIEIEDMHGAFRPQPAVSLMYAVGGTFVVRCHTHGVAGLKPFD